MKRFIKWLKSENPVDTVGGLILYGVASIAIARLIDGILNSL